MTNKSQGFGEVLVSVDLETGVCSPATLELHFTEKSYIRWTAAQLYGDGYKFLGVVIVADAGAPPGGPSESGRSGGLEWGAPQFEIDNNGHSAMTVYDRHMDMPGSTRMGNHSYTIIYQDKNGTVKTIDPTIRNVEN